MPYQLLLRSVLERARTIFPNKEIVSRTAAGIFRYTYGDMYRRVDRLAGALQRLGVVRGDRVATLAWNHHRHLELYFAVPCMGAVLHTLNIRLFPEQLEYIINHAEDKVIFVDPDLLPVLEGIREKLPTVAHFVVMCARADLPATRLAPVSAYEELLEQAAEGFRFPADLDENLPAAMCYTSATTGHPKGVLYSHRTLYLHTTAVCMADTLGVCERDTVLPVVPMFHANAWGTPWAAAFTGARQVLPGPRPDPRIIAELIQAEQVTLPAGVPTVWMGLLAQIEKERYDFSSVRAFVVGGSAAPRALIEAFDQKAGAPILHAYGMTEAAPLTHACRLKSSADGLSESERYRLRAKQGILAPGLEQRIVTESGEEAPWDGKTLGELYLRGPWIATEYYRDDRTRETFIDGWYRTGDVATLDSEGYLELCDRVKDMVKSGGEWISSVDLENQLMAHPAVREAAVIALAHPRWGERPVACVVLKQGHEAVSEADLRQFFEGRVAHWWIPDRILFIEEVPKTGVGKFDKKVLRARFAGLLSD